MEELKKRLYLEYPFLEKKGKLLFSFHKRKVIQKNRNEKLLILLVGVQGAGKTTYCNKNFPEYNVINLDEILREYLMQHDVEFSEYVNGEINKIFFERAEKELNEKGIAILDSGAVNISVRVMILDYLREKYTKAILIVLNPPMNTIRAHIKKQIYERARPDLWEDVCTEYDLLQLQIEKEFLEMGVDEVYRV